MEKSKIKSYAFFGSPRFAEIVLSKLIDGGYPPALLVCNPDRPVGRKKVLTPPPVKVLAEKNGLPVWQPDRLTESNVMGQLSNVQFGVIASYSKIIPKAILDLFPLGVIGVHPSLLPKHRGASPIQTALLHGDETTGVTLFLTDEKVDHGPIIAKSEIRISKSETYETLHDALANLGGELLARTLAEFVTGKAKTREQNHEEATFSKKFTAEDAFVRPLDLQGALEGTSEATAIRIERMIRALNPEPGVWTILDKELRTTNYELPRNKRIKLLGAQLDGNKLVLTRIQVEGKQPIKINN